MKKTLKKSVSFLLAALCMGSMVACGPTGSEGNETVISVINFGGGVGEEWLKKAAVRFQDMKVNESYEDGKTGVFIDYISQQSINTSNMDSDAYNIYFNQSTTSARSLAQQGFLMDISDIVTGSMAAYGETGTIEDKIDENYRIMCMGPENRYYALPHYEFYPGVTYDVELFDNYDLYFAASGEQNVTTEFGTAAFITAANPTKSLGPDGEANTYDDGLPSSLKELLILCSHMSGLGITPFALSGKVPNYINYLVGGLWASLAGYEELQCNYSFNGTVDVVTGVSETEALFPNSSTDYVKKPTVESKTVSEQDGYLAYSSAARYYAIAFVDIAVNKGWFTLTSTQGSSHVEEQKYFIFNGKKLGGKQVEKIGMLIEGSYWYNESDNVGNFTNYFTQTKTEERKISWMSLPTSLDVSVTEKNQGRKPTMVETASAFTYINANIAGNEGLTRACKEFVQFLYSDKELSYFTQETGVAKGLSYKTENIEDMNYYKRTLTAIREYSNILYMGHNNKTFLDGFATFSLNTGGQMFKYGSSFNCLTPMRNGTHAYTIFEHGASNMKNAWGTLYKGE